MYTQQLTWTHSRYRFTRYVQHVARLATNDRTARCRCDTTLECDQ